MSNIHRAYLSIANIQESEFREVLARLVLYGIVAEVAKKKGTRGALPLPSPPKHPFSRRHPRRPAHGSCPLNKSNPAP